MSSESYWQQFHSEDDKFITNTATAVVTRVFSSASVQRTMFMFLIRFIITNKINDQKEEKHLPFTTSEVKCSCQNKFKNNPPKKKSSLFSCRLLFSSLPKYSVKISD